MTFNISNNVLCYCFSTTRLTPITLSLCTPAVPHILEKDSPTSHCAFSITLLTKPVSAFTFSVKKWTAPFVWSWRGKKRGFWYVVFIIPEHNLHLCHFTLLKHVYKRFADHCHSMQKCSAYLCPFSNPFKPSIITVLRSQVHMSVLKPMLFALGTVIVCGVCKSSAGLGQHTWTPNTPLAWWQLFRWLRFWEKHVCVSAGASLLYSTTFDICFGGGLEGWNA